MCMGAFADHLMLEFGRRVKEDGEGEGVGGTTIKKKIDSKSAVKRDVVRNLRRVLGVQVPKGLDDTLGLGHGQDQEAPENVETLDDALGQDQEAQEQDFVFDSDSDESDGDGPAEFKHFSDK